MPETKDQTKREQKKAKFEEDVKKTTKAKIAEATAPENSDVDQYQKQSEEFSFAPKKPDNWDSMTAEEKNKWDLENRNNLMAPIVVSKLDELKGTYKPYQEPTPTIDEKKYADLEKKKRKRRWLDYVYGGATGYLGQQLNPAELPTNIIQSKQDQMLQNYKDVVKKNRLARDKWYLDQYNTRMKIVSDMYSKSKTPEEKDMWEKEMELEKKKLAQAGVKIGQAQQKIEQQKEKTRTGPYPTYTYKTEGGQTINIPMQGAKAQELHNAIKTADDLKAQRDALQDQIDTEVRKTEGTFAFGFGTSDEEAKAAKKAELQPQLDEINAKIKEAEDNVLSIFQSENVVKKQTTDTDKSSSTTTKSKSTKTAPKTMLGSILNQSKQ